MLVYILLTVFVILLTIFFLKTRKEYEYGPTRNKSTEPASLLVVLGSGGHTSEILRLVKVMGNHYSPRYYVIADTDVISEHKVRQVEKERMDGGDSKDYQLFVIPRSREVKQSYLTSVLTTVQAVIFSMPLVFKLRPEIILCNGPGTCIPICFAGLLLKFIAIQDICAYWPDISKFVTPVVGTKLVSPFWYHLLGQTVVMHPEDGYYLCGELLPGDFTVTLWKNFVPFFRQFLCTVARTGSKISKGKVLGKIRMISNDDDV